MEEEDKYKTSFTTLWGTHYFNWIPFALKNVGDTFQRATYHSFKDLIKKFMADY